jgi:hypothetical protein
MDTLWSEAVKGVLGRVGRDVVNTIRVQIPSIIQYMY